jgi:D-amino-acid dehydrogenase
MSDALRFAGTMEVGVFDGRVDMRRVRGIVRSVSEYLPGFGAGSFEDCPVWTGLRPCSPDGLPYVGRWRGLENVSVAAGHAMLGLSLAPATGELIGAILAGEKPAIGMNLLSPDRYA